MDRQVPAKKCHGGQRVRINFFYMKHIFSDLLMLDKVHNLKNYIMHAFYFPPVICSFGNNFPQVCGNSESVKFISEWLHIWHERDVRAFKYSSGSEKCSVPDDNHDCYLTDSDSENIDEGDSLKNVLLVTGPIGVCTIYIFVKNHFKVCIELFFVANL